MEHLVLDESKLTPMEVVSRRAQISYEFMSAALLGVARAAVDMSFEEVNRAGRTANLDTVKQTVLRSLNRSMDTARSEWGVMVPAKTEGGRNGQNQESSRT